MSQADRVQQQIFAAIAQSGLQHREGDGFIAVLAPPVDGQNQSTEVRIRSSLAGPGEDILVSMVAPVIGDLPVDDGKISVNAHIFCNSLNQNQTFGRWVYYPEEGVITVEHELVGNDLDPSEIMNTLLMVAHSADRWDDRIQDELGAGKRLFSETEDVVE